MAADTGGVLCLASRVGGSCMFNQTGEQLREEGALGVCKRCEEDGVGLFDRDIGTICQLGSLWRCYQRSGSCIVWVMLATQEVLVFQCSEHLRSHHGIDVREVCKLVLGNRRVSFKPNQRCEEDELDVGETKGH